MGNSIAYTVKCLSFSYGDKKVLDNISFEIKRGEITTFIGGNGCGKSTLFGILTKSLKADRGEIQLDGELIGDIKLRDFSKKVAIVYQNNSHPDDLSVRQVVEYGRTPYRSFYKKRDAEDDDRLVEEALKITDIYKYRDRNISKLSGGQRQRVWLAMALAQDTEILFLDEPTTYLDIKYQMDILGLVKNLNKKYGKTIVMVLHDINQALMYSDNIIAMKDSRIAGTGTAEEIIKENLINEIFDVKLKVCYIDNRPLVITC